VKLCAAPTLEWVRLRRLWPLLLVVPTLELAGGAPAGLGPRIVETSFRSRAVRGVIHLEVYLPADYTASGNRYPVIYFLHGLPASSTSYHGADYIRTALDRANRSAILVEPQAARDHDTDPEYLDWGPGRNWETAVGRELPRFVDRSFRTIPNRRGRALVGLSAGGYGAALLALHHLEAFSVVESWSGYFHPTNPAGTAPLNLGSRKNARASAHTYVRMLRTAFRRRPTFFAFYVGRGDSRFRAENLQLHRELSAAGVPHLFRLYPGAHAQTVWSAHATAWLRLALAHLETSR
jgi:enterochelin esterase-like enzyme